MKTDLIILKFKQFFFPKLSVHIFKLMVIAPSPARCGDSSEGRMIIGHDLKSFTHSRSDLELIFNAFVMRR